MAKKGEAANCKLQTAILKKVTNFSLIIRNKKKAQPFELSLNNKEMYKL